MALCLAILLSGCSTFNTLNLQNEGEKKSPPPSGPRSEIIDFSMSGVKIKINGPENYLHTAWARTHAASALTPPENIFAVLMPAGNALSPDNPPSSPALNGRRLVIVSAKPEFMNAYIETNFFKALCNDFTRVNGIWKYEVLERFQRLVMLHYRNQKPFSHNLGVLHYTQNSLSMVRIVRENSVTAQGNLAGYSQKNSPAHDEMQLESTPASITSFEPGRTSPPSDLKREYFAGGNYRIVVQNILNLNGRCFNVYFSAPMEDAENLQALLEENLKYITLLTEENGKTEPAIVPQDAAASKNPKQES